ncbi:response regulator transcription factor [Salisediminibacterium beveridgei]|uniref:Two component transcriptional regulatory protein DevR n=1 Tax=Salisediminibacterium beveridgei TaxID=632773 RepID=A0A1D7QXS9_9BACI|nr:response regulator transcription factor [Salisediminibacterium beveridgei]AOM83813.1 Two component transcriptional regulatory protein DevR [Salisediminibacterium beveridgei]
MPAKIKVMIVDDHQVVRKGLKMFLEADRQLTVCGEAGSLKEMLDLIGEVEPDVVLLDFKLPDGDGITGCSAVCSSFPDAKVLILTAYADETLMADASEAGALAYLIKDIESDELISKIKSISSQPSDCRKMKELPNKQLKREYNLSSRDIQILDLLSMGKVNKEIALQLNLNEKTIRNNLHKVFKKINVTNRTEAAGFWARQKRLHKTSQ